MGSPRRVFEITAIGIPAHWLLKLSKPDSGNTGVSCAGRARGLAGPRVKRSIPGSVCPAREPDPRMVLAGRELARYWKRSFDKGPYNLATLHRFATQKIPNPNYYCGHRTGL